MYHQVGHFDEPRAHRASYCHVDRFRAQMAFLKIAGYRVIGIGEALEGLYGGGPLPRRSVVLSFDDGYRNFYEHAYPILRDHGYPALLFAVSGRIGATSDWLDGSRAAALMGAPQLREIRAGGVAIGAHSVTHPRLSRLAPAAAAAEVGGSKAALEDLLGMPVETFAYPYGDYNEMVRDCVAAASFRAAFTCSRGPANSAPHPLEIPRKAVSWGDSLLGLWWKLALKNRRKDRYA
jgi:peptidoglycan/xylan/chitin deacetylase (PgdA/CDA1 family)